MARAACPNFTRQGRQRVNSSPVPLIVAAAALRPAPSIPIPSAPWPLSNFCAHAGQVYSPMNKCAPANANRANRSRTIDVIQACSGSFRIKMCDEHIKFVQPFTPWPVRGSAAVRAAKKVLAESQRACLFCPQFLGIFM